MVASDDEAKQGSDHQTMTCSGKRADTIYAARTHQHYYGTTTPPPCIVLVDNWCPWSYGACLYAISEPNHQLKPWHQITPHVASSPKVQLKYCIQLHGINKGTLGNHICCHISMQLKRNSELSSIEWWWNLSQCHLSILIKHFRLWWVIMPSIRKFLVHHRARGW